jgi:hypothetical protein
MLPASAGHCTENARQKKAEKRVLNELRDKDGEVNVRLSETP